jgi:hypothetical protein
MVDNIPTERLPATVGKMLVRICTDPFSHRDNPQERPPSYEGLSVSSGGF